MTMKEACAYSKSERLRICEEHRQNVLKEHGTDGFITEFNDKEYRRVKPEQKTSFGKSRKPVFNSIWRHYDLPRIQN